MANSATQTSIVIPKIEKPFSELFNTLSELLGMDRSELFASMLHSALSGFMAERHRLVDIDPLILENLDEAIQQLFGTVLYQARYRSLKEVPMADRAKVIERMGRR